MQAQMNRVWVAASLSVGLAGGSFLNAYLGDGTSASSPKRAHASTSGFDLSRLSRLDEWIGRSLSNKTFAGASYAIYRGDQLVQKNFHGYSNLEKQKKIDENTLFRLYSMSKPVTAVGLMILFEQGKFNLNDPVAKYIPSFADIPGIYDYEANKKLDPKDITMENVANGKVKLKPLKEPVRIWHLMTHTSGLGYLFDPQGRFDPVERLYNEVINPSTSSFQTETLSSLIDMKLAQLPLGFEPGSRWAYSFSIDVMARLIEVLSGQPVDQFLFENIFKPLGMQHTAFYLDNKFSQPLKESDLAVAYAKNCEPMKSPMWHAETEKKSGSLLMGGGSGGGLIGTLGDYVKFGRMLLNLGKCAETGEQILSPQTVKFFTSNQLKNNGEYYEIIHDYCPLKPIAARRGVGCGLGFGVISNNKVKEGTGLMQPEGSYYWDGAANTKWWIDPKNELLVVFMTQCLGVSGSEIQKELDTYVYGAMME